LNYTELVAAVSSTTENTFNTADMNRFIVQAETRAYLAIEFPSLRKTGTLSATLNVPFVDAPTDFIAPDALATIDPSTGAYVWLLPKDPTFIREAYPIPAAAGAPKYYAVYGPALTAGQPNTELRFLLGPTPSVTYAMELQYYFYPESITTAASGQTWLGDNLSPVLLYGALSEANTFMKGEADIQTMYDGKLKDAMTLAASMGLGRIRTDLNRKAPK
jgi:hypothetical protein